jgi:DNA gyrase subunit A
MLITDGGKLIRMPADGIPTIGRNTQGVRLIRLEEGEVVVAMERLAEREEGAEREVSPEVAAARAEEQTLAEEDLGEEASADEEESDEEEDEAEDEGEDGGPDTSGKN